MGAGPAWMQRGTQGHVAAPRGPAQRAYVARIYLIFYYTYIYKWVFVLPYMGRLFKPDGFIIIIRVGLTHSYLFISGDVDARGASDRRRGSISRVDHVN